jgi:hypothetical protein
MKKNFPATIQLQKLGVAVPVPTVENNRHFSTLHWMRINGHVQKNC